MVIKSFFPYLQPKIRTMIVEFIHEIPSLCAKINPKYSPCGCYPNCFAVVRRWWMDSVPLGLVFGVVEGEFLNHQIGQLWMMNCVFLVELKRKKGRRVTGTGRGS